MKKTLGILLSALLAFLCLSPVSAAGAHEHSGPLEALRTEAGLQTPCCGVFRCSACGGTYEASVTPADVGMPIVKTTGSLAGISKENKVTVNVAYSDGAMRFESAATLKWQGGTSLRYAKKNYNIQFVKENGSKNKVELIPAWGRQSKYTLKANWVDFSACRNVVSAKLWGEIVHSRVKDDALDSLVNGGAVDGFPVLLYHNGDFQGLYTLNTPKDKWIFDMTGENPREGLLFGEVWSDSVNLKEPIADVNDPAASGWDVEYCSTEEDADVGIAWLGEGMNAFIDFLKNNDGQAFKDGIGRYTDVDRCVDYMLYVYFICGVDNVGKNILWATWDGVKYLPSAYDMDGVWGMLWNGEFPDIIPGWSRETPLRDNLLFTRLLANFHDDVVARYVQLREDVLAYRNIERQFTSFTRKIPAFVYAAEREKWPDEPNQDLNGLSQILDFAARRIESLDTAFGVSVTEKTESAYRAAFACENGARVYVYPSQNYAEAPVRAAAAWSVNGETGELTKTDGQIRFRVDAPEGYTAEIGIEPLDGYKNLKTPAETGEANVYRVTKITKDLTVRVRLTEDASEAEGYAVRFVTDPGAEVWVYPGSDYAQPAVQTNSAVSADPSTGVPTKTDGQVNFRLASAEPYDYEIAVSPELYKNLKGPAETGQPDTYRITKIAGDLTVTVRARPHTHVWGEWIVLREATETEEGLRQRVCLGNSGHVETQTIPKKEPGGGNSFLDFFRRVVEWFRSLFARARALFGG